MPRWQLSAYQLCIIWGINDSVIVLLERFGLEMQSTLCNGKTTVGDANIVVVRNILAKSILDSHRKLVGYGSDIGYTSGKDGLYHVSGYKLAGQYAILIAGERSAVIDFCSRVRLKIDLALSNRQRSAYSHYIVIGRNVRAARILNDNRNVVGPGSDIGYGIGIGRNYTMSRREFSRRQSILMACERRSVIGLRCGIRQNLNAPMEYLKSTGLIFDFVIIRNVRTVSVDYRGGNRVRRRTNGSLATADDNLGNMSVVQRALDAHENTVGICLSRVMAKSRYIARKIRARGDLQGFDIFCQIK